MPPLITLLEETSASLVGDSDDEDATCDWLTLSLLSLTCSIVYFFPFFAIPVI